MSKNHEQAADGLEAILGALEPLGTARDRRIRQAIERAAKALREGSDPATAIEDTYRQ
jgi:hypothetical protein